MAGKIYLPLFLIVFFGLLFCSCSSKKPVLYPNAKLEKVGQEAAQADIDDCMRLAEEHGVNTGRGEKVVEKSAKRAVVGAAVGAAVGAIFGDFGRGAAAGAAGGAAGGAAQGAVDNDPDVVFKRFVDKCLRDKGYEPIGWK